MNTQHRPYYDFATFLGKYFEGKVQKISVHAGFTCPNRDGAVGVGGGTYCNNQTFNPEYCRPELSVTQQLVDGIRFFSRKYPTMRYLAYFQAYTNTYGELERLKAMYEEALAVEGVVGLVIGTRPDCMPDCLLDYLEELSRRTFLMVEYGIESANDDTLRRINRGHDFATAADAIRRTHERGILTGGHIILGLPGEHRDELLRQASLLATLPLDMIKLHQLQLIRGTRMAREYEEHPEDFHLYSVDEYIELAIDYIERIPQTVVVERFISQSPRSLLIAPDWGMKNFEFVDRLRRRMAERNTWQGRLVAHEERPMLELRDLYIGYSDDANRHIVAHRLNASLPHGVLTCLIGVNGVGKSTLMRTMAAFQPPLRGEVYVDGKSIGEYSPKELSEHIGVVLTEKNMPADLTVEEVVGLGRAPYTNFWGTLTDEDRKVVNEAIALTGLDTLRRRKIHQISDGERQKVMIAKALAQQTPIIFLDEPTAFLDYPSKIAMMQLLRSLAHEQHKLIVLSTHDLDIAFQTTDTIWLLQQTGLLAGTLAELSDSGAISRFLDGEGLYYDVPQRRIVLK